MAIKSDLGKEWFHRWLAVSTVAGFFSLPSAIFLNHGVPIPLAAVYFALPMSTYLTTMQMLLRRRDEPWPFPVTVLVMGCGYFLTFATALMTSIFLSIWTLASMQAGRFMPPWQPDILKAWLAMFSSSTIGWTMLFGFFGMILVHFFFQFNRKLGPGILWQWLSGRYHKPKAEERIVMFLDMRDSTTLAEQLGDIKFSGLVKQFISDVSLAVQESKGEVSHFIGDEVVATWQPSRGLPKAKCLEAVRISRDRIAKRAEFYESRFGLVPSFKAGMHIGPVVATEVGEAKSEIVLHGDAMNTAARIQGECNRLEEEFLVSSELMARLEAANGWSTKLVGEVDLKGKANPVEVVALRRT